MGSLPVNSNAVGIACCNCDGITRLFYDLFCRFHEPFSAHHYVICKQLCLFLFFLIDLHVPPPRHSPLSLLSCMGQKYQNGE